MPDPCPPPEQSTGPCSACTPIGNNGGSGSGSQPGDPGAMNLCNNMDLGSGSGSGPSVPVWLVTNVCPVFDDDGSGSGGPGRYLRTGDAVGGSLTGYFPNPILTSVVGGTF